MKKEILQAIKIGKVKLTEQQRLQAIKEREKINKYLNNCTYYKKLKGN